MYWKYTEHRSRPRRSQNDEVQGPIHISAPQIAVLAKLSLKRRAERVFDP